jgi:hypothetical protein
LATGAFAQEKKIEFGVQTGYMVSANVSGNTPQIGLFYLHCKNSHLWGIL